MQLPRLAMYKPGYSALGCLAWPDGPASFYFVGNCRISALGYCKQAGEGSHKMDQFCRNGEGYRRYDKSGIYNVRLLKEKLYANNNTLNDAYSQFLWS